MLMIEEIKQELEKARGYYEEEMKRLEEWEKGEDDGNRLKKLRNKLDNREGDEKQLNRWEEMHPKNKLELKVTVKEE
nr:6210_t:CDS:2 [Entrophospora candida]